MVPTGLWPRILSFLNEKATVYNREGAISVIASAISNNEKAQNFLFFENEKKLKLIQSILKAQKQSHLTNKRGKFQENPKYYI